MDWKEYASAFLVFSLAETLLLYAILRIQPFLHTFGRMVGRRRELPHAEERTALMEQAAAIWETATSRSLVTMDREGIEATWQKTREG